MKQGEKYSVLFVCLGNICRSPAGEGIFLQMIKEAGLQDAVFVDSAGTSGYHDGELPDHRMRTHGRRRGYDFCSRSRKFTADDFERFDLILAMDDSNLHNILRLSPDVDSQKKVFRMVDFSQQFGHDHIPDPYYSGAEGFELVLDLLEDACKGLLAHVETQLSLQKNSTKL